MEQNHQEMQLLSYTTTPPHEYASSSSHPPPWPGRYGAGAGAGAMEQFQSPSLDLQLSISVSRPFKAPSSDCRIVGVEAAEALKWEAAEQIRLAAMEKAYAEHMMELTRREMELAQSEFMRARSLWERAREEVERAEKMRERAFISSSSSSSCMEREITCLSCSQNFRPSNKEFN